MGFVGKLKKAARGPAGWFHPAGISFKAVDGARRHFERHTKLGKAIRNLYHPVYSAGSLYSGGVHGPTGSIVGRY